MTIIVRDGTNTPRTITEIQVRDGTNMPRDISEIRVRDSNNVSRIVFSTGAAMTAEASPSTVYGFTSGTGTATTDPTTVTPTGGTAPYTYAWTIDNLDGPVTPTAGSPPSATTTFTQTSIPPGGSYYAQWICTVTDHVGNIATASAYSFWTDN